MLLRYNGWYIQRIEDSTFYGIQYCRQGPRQWTWLTVDGITEWPTRKEASDALQRAVDQNLSPPIGR